MGPHSYDPGISPTGLFWTIAIPPDSVRVDFDDAIAVLRLRNICAVFDAFEVLNSFDITHALGFVGGIINALHLRWSGVTRSVLGFSDPVNRFAGDFLETSAAIEVTATTPASQPPFTPAAQDGFRFVADPTTVKVNFAQIGKERNGALLS